MTATLTGRPAPSVGAIGAPRLLAGLDRVAAVDWTAHQSWHGRLPTVTATRLTTLAEDVGLVGRGGAAFAVARKLRAVGPQPVVVVNGHESEPASRKDRVLMRQVPHLVLDGAVLVAQALGAVRVVIAVADVGATHALRAACRERTDAAIVEIAAGHGGFVAGEARAVVQAVDGRRPRPPGRRIHATERGVGGRSTFVGNVETFAQLAVLVRLGAAAYGHTGTTAEPGTSLLTVTGAVTRSGVLEVPTGVPLSVVRQTVGAAPAQAVVIGGYHGSWLPGEVEVPLAPTALQQVGVRFGAGVVAVVGHDTCALGELARVTSWLADQSTRQCGPCLNGLPALAAAVHALGSGRADRREIDRLAGLVDGRGACSHPDGAVRFVASGVHVLAAEIQRHRDTGTCGRPVLGHLPLDASKERT